MTESSTPVLGTRIHGKHGAENRFSLPLPIPDTHALIQTGKVRFTRIVRSELQPAVLREALREKRRSRRITAVFHAPPCSVHTQTKRRHPYIYASKRRHPYRKSAKNGICSALPGTRALHDGEGGRGRQGTDGGRRELERNNHAPSKSYCSPMTA